MQASIQASMAVSPSAFGVLVGDAVEDVDEHQEQGDEERHPTRDDIRRHDEAYPGYDDEQAWSRRMGREVIRVMEITTAEPESEVGLTRRQIVGDDVVRNVSVHHHFEPRDGVVAQGAIAQLPVPARRGVMDTS